MRAGPVVAIACAVLSALGCAQSAPRRACAAPSESPVPFRTSLQPAAPSPARAIDDVSAAAFAPVTVTPAFRPPARPPAEVAELEGYLRTVRRKVLPKWWGPVDGRKGVDLEFQIAADGCVSYAKLLSKSDRAVGAGVLKSLIRAAPFDPPPRGLESEILIATFTARSN